MAGTEDFEATLNEPLAVIIAGTQSSNPDKVLLRDALKKLEATAKFWTTQASAPVMTGTRAEKANKELAALNKKKAEIATGVYSRAVTLLQKKKLL